MSRGKATRFAHLQSGEPIPSATLDWIDAFAALSRRFPPGLWLSFDGQGNVHARVGEEQEEIEDLLLPRGTTRYHGED